MYYIVGVIGFGRMGSQIVTELLTLGHDVVLCSASKRNQREIEDRAYDSLVKRHIPDSQARNLLGHLSLHRDVGWRMSLGECEMIIESTSKNIEVKRRAMDMMSSVCTDDTIVATNTSSMSIATLSKLCKRPDRFVGIHFFNPIHNMKLAEVAHTDVTDDAVIKDLPGFIINHLLLWQINEVAYFLDSNVFSVQDIDLTVRKGLNHPVGPFQLAGYIVLNICYAILTRLRVSTRNARFIPTESISRLVSEGKRGKKTRTGFHEYS